MIDMGVLSCLVTLSGLCIPSGNRLIIAREEKPYYV
jgi:hypothetical protein